MRIVVLAHRVPFPPNKGEKIRTYHQIQYLRARGHELTVCALLHEPGDAHHAESLATLLEVEVLAVPTRYRWPRLLAGLLSNQTLSVSNFRVSELQARFNARIQGGPVDAVLCTGSAMAHYVFECPALPQLATQAPVLIMDFMDLDSDKWDQYRRHSRFPMSWLYRRESLLLAHYEKRINSHFDSSLFVSQNEVDLFIGQGVAKPERVRVVGNGVDTKAFHPPEHETNSPATDRLATGAPHMVFVGVMDYRPNEDAMLWFVEELWDRVLALWPDARFTIVGLSPSEKIVKLRRFQGVEVTGEVESVLPYFHQANVFVAPFRLARGLQNKVLQAFAAGIPVITSASGAEGIDCEHGEHLLVASGADEYLHALQRLMDDPEFYCGLRDRALALVHESYSWDSQNRGLLECLGLPESTSQ